MAEIEGLIERLEKATGGDRKLDAEIWVATTEGARLTKDSFGFTTVEQNGVVWRLPEVVPYFTACLDAALALVERVRPGAWYRLGCGRNHPDEPLYGAQILLPDVPAEEDGAVLGEGEHNDSLALAILLALLRTLETQNGD